MAQVYKSDISLTFYFFSIGNKQLNPLPGKSWTPPPTWKRLDPLRNLEKW